MHPLNQWICTRSEFRVNVNVNASNQK